MPRAPLLAAVTLVVALATTALATTPLAAQTTVTTVTAAAVAGLPSDTRLRLTLADGSHRTGWILFADRDSVSVAPDRTATDRWQRVGRDQLRAWQVPAGRRRGHGALVGTAVGGTLGLALIGVGIHSDITCKCDVMLPSELFTVPAAAALTLVGAGVGALAAPRGWSHPTPIALGARSASADLRIRPTMRDGHLGLAVGARF